MGTTAQKLEYLQGTKNVLKTQLTAKGVTVSSNTTFRQMANLVGNIQTGYKMETKTITLTGYGTELTYSGFSFNPTWCVMVKANNPGNYGTDTITSVVATPTYGFFAVEGRVRLLSTDSLSVTFSGNEITIERISNGIRFPAGSYMIMAFDGTPPDFPEWE